MSVAKATKMKKKVIGHNQTHVHRHTQTHRHTHTHARTHRQTHTHVRTHTHRHTQAHTHTRYAKEERAWIGEEKSDEGAGEKERIVGGESLRKQTGMSCMTCDIYIYIYIYIYIHNVYIYIYTYINTYPTFRTRRRWACAHGGGLRTAAHQTSARACRRC